MIFPSLIFILIAMRKSLFAHFRSIVINELFTLLSMASNPIRLYIRLTYIEYVHCVGETDACNVKE